MGYELVPISISTDFFVNNARLRVYVRDGFITASVFFPLFVVFFFYVFVITNVSFFFFVRVCVIRCIFCPVQGTLTNHVVVPHDDHSNNNGLCVTTPCPLHVRTLSLLTARNLQLQPYA